VQTALYILATALVVTGVVYFLSHAISNKGSAVLPATLMPSGNTTPYETDFSYELALAMKGDTRLALESFEEKIAAQPLGATVRLKAAEMYQSAGQFDRARDLYREVQRIPNVTSKDDVIASYRLIDLYRGKLGDPNKSLPEFRRLIERYPNSQIEQNAREALANLKKDISFG
jgi:tetratricopeptide (TPR) repeat protein